MENKVLAASASRMVSVYRLAEKFTKKTPTFKEWSDIFNALDDNLETDKLIRERYSL